LFFIKKKRRGKTQRGKKKIKIKLVKGY